MDAGNGVGNGLCAGFGFGFLLGDGLGHGTLFGGFALGLSLCLGSQTLGLGLSGGSLFDSADLAPVNIAAHAYAEGNLDTGFEGVDVLDAVGGEGVVVF